MNKNHVVQRVIPVFGITLMVTIKFFIQLKEDKKNHLITGQWDEVKYNIVRLFSNKALLRK